MCTTYCVPVSFLYYLCDLIAGGRGYRTLLPIQMLQFPIKSQYTVFHKILSPKKTFKSLSIHLWLKCLHIFLQIIICKNWNIYYKSLLLILYPKQESEWGPGAKTLSTFQPGQNPKVLIPSPRQQDSSVSQHTNDLRIKACPDPSIHAAPITPLSPDYTQLSTADSE